MGWCNNCYNELYKVNKTYISSDKMWLNIAQQFRDENEKLQDKVADLEAKLEESEKDKQFYFFENGEKGLKIRELKQQLAEKEEELKYKELI